MGRRASGVRHLILLSVPREFMGRGALEFDVKARVEARLRSDGPPLTIVRSSLFMESWLAALGSRLPLRGGRQSTLDRGFWMARFAGATTQQSIDRLGIALLPGRGEPRHAFIAVQDVADCLGNVGPRVGRPR